MTLAALIEAYRDGYLTRDELFASVTRLLSADPGALRTARAALNFDPVVGSEFESWLQELRDRPQIILGGRPVPVASALIDALAAEQSVVRQSVAEGWVLTPKRPLHVIPAIDIANRAAPISGVP